MGAELKDKVAWINGASGTIGKAIAAALAGQGARLVLSSRNQEVLTALAKDLKESTKCEVMVLPLDVTNREQVDAAAGKINKDFGRIDLLVNSTSLSKFGDFLQLQDSDWEAVFQHKLFAYIRTCRAVIPYMVQQKYGRIVNVSGRSGHQPTQPLHTAGMSANAAVNILTKALANMYGSNNIRANVVAPGPVLSARYDAVVKVSEQVAQVGSHPTTSTFNTPPVSGKAATPEEIAEVVSFLLSERSSQLTGVVLQADGGSTAAL